MLIGRGYVRQAVESGNVIEADDGMVAHGGAWFARRDETATKCKYLPQQLHLGAFTPGSQSRDNAAVEEAELLNGLGPFSISPLGSLCISNFPSAPNNGPGEPRPALEASMHHMHPELGMYS